jgi:WD40 repeat protein
MIDSEYLKGNILYSFLFTAHEDGIWAGAWTKSLKDGSEHIISGSIDDKVKIWSWYKEKLELKYTCTGHRLGVVSVDVNPQGTGTKLVHLLFYLFDLNSRGNMCTGCSN